MKNYAVLSIFQYFKYLNMILKNLVALDARQNFKTKKSSERRKRKQLLKHKQNVKNMHR